MLILQPLEREVMRWLGERHDLRVAPHLIHDRSKLLDTLGNVRALIAPPSVRVDARALLHAPVLRAVACVNDDSENIDLNACERAGVAVIRSGSATAQAEAEFMLGALLAMSRRVAATPPDGVAAGRELASMTVGLVGLSPSARTMARLLRAFGARVVGYEPSLHANAGAWQRLDAEPLALRDLLAQSDAVCVQLGYFSRYRGLLGDRLLAHCKPEQVIVSITDAEVFDTDVLGDAMRSGRIAAAWLDRVSSRAIEPGGPLHGLATLHVTARLASSTGESRLRRAWSVARRIDALLSPAATAAPIVAGVA